MEYIIVSIVVGVISSTMSIFVVRKLDKAKFQVFIEQAKAKAKVIEHEAEVSLKDAQLKAKFECDKEFKHARREYDIMLSKIEKKERELNEHLESELRIIRLEKEEIIEKNKKITTLKEGIEQQKRTYEEKTYEAIKILENASGLTLIEAKDLMLKKVKEDSRAEIASIFRKNIKLQNKTLKMKLITCSQWQLLDMQVSLQLKDLLIMCLLVMKKQKVKLLVKKVEILKLLRCY